MGVEVVILNYLIYYLNILKYMNYTELFKYNEIQYYPCDCCFSRNSEFIIRNLKFDCNEGSA